MVELNPNDINYFKTQIITNPKLEIKQVFMMPLWKMLTV
jgi:hypothetical protein